MKKNKSKEQARLNKTALECIKELDKLNIPYGFVNEFKINSRAKKRWGRASKKGDIYAIEISESLLDGEHNEGLKDTIFHELLHTCPNCMNHGSQWKQYAKKVNDTLGYNISRVSSAESKGFNDAELTIKESKYLFQCQKCGALIGKSRQSRFTRNWTLYRCGNCGGELEKIY